MARLCERPGCSAPASCSYGIDSPALRVWIDSLESVAGGALGARVGALCRRHADAMVVPRGWRVDDRRPGGEVARHGAPLDQGRPVRPAAPVPTTPVTGGASGTLPDDDDRGSRTVLRRMRRRRRPTGPPPEQLVLLGLEPLGAPEQEVVTSPPPEDSADGAVGEAEVAPVAPGPVPSGAPEVPHDDARRVDAPSAVDAESPVVDTASAEEGPTEPRSPGTDETPVSPWRPVFDQTDDLGGLLAARGPLLSRAFGRRSRPPSPAGEGDPTASDGD